MAVIVAVAQLGLGLMFVFAGVGKLAAPRAFRKTLGALGIPFTQLSLVVPAAEVGAGVLIAVAPASAAAAAAALVLLVGFAAVGARALVAGQRIECACFGGNGGGILGWRQVVLLPVGAAILVLLRSSDALIEGVDGAQSLAGAVLVLAGFHVASNAPMALRAHRLLKTVST